MDDVSNVFRSMVSYYAGDVRQINHFIKVYGFAKEIGAAEGLSPTTLKILEIAALTHDIGVMNSKIKYNNSNGEHQQVEGPPEVRKMLETLAIDEGIIERVCWLIAHHHTYDHIDSIDYQILVEADFLVNIFEEDISLESVKRIREKIFKTGFGQYLLDQLYVSSNNPNSRIKISSFAQLKMSLGGIALGKRPKVILRLIDQKGKCRCHYGHKIGDEFDFDTGRGMLCPMAMHVAFPYVDILRYGGKLPVNSTYGKFVFCCPDVDVINVFEIELLEMDLPECPKEAFVSV